jgi:hypothetical protein
MHTFVKHLLCGFDTSRAWGAFNPDVFFNTFRAENRVTKGDAKIPKWPEKESTVDTVNCK